MHSQGKHWEPQLQVVPRTIEDSEIQVTKCFMVKFHLIIWFAAAYFKIRCISSKNRHLIHEALYLLWTVNMFVSFRGVSELVWIHQDLSIFNINSVFWPSPELFSCCLTWVRALLSDRMNSETLL